MNTSSPPLLSHAWWQRIFCLMIIPVIIPLLAAWAAFAQNSISDFFPCLFREFWKMLPVSLARNLFWPEAGRCFHFEVDESETEPGGPWMTWKEHFVFYDPVTDKNPDWSWNLEDIPRNRRTWSAAIKKPNAIIP